MEKPEEIRQPIRPSRGPRPPLPPQPDERRCDVDDLPIFPVSPPPLPWPRVFPSL